MKHRIRELLCVNAASLMIAFSVCAQTTPSTQESRSHDKSAVARTSPIFVFQADEFWLNLHHFLYVLGRAENKETDSSRQAVSGAPAAQERGLATASKREQTIWREAVTSYADGPSKRDLVFDESLAGVTLALSHAADAKSLAGFQVDPAIASILERAAPIYRKTFWAKQRDANRTWQKSMQSMVDLHGATVLAFITNAYKLKWPATGFPVHVSAFSNWAGAYSTTGNLLVLSSLNEGNQGAYGLETIFHEGMHQWDDQVLEALRAQAVKLNKLTPRGVSHALIFFTAGEAVRRVAPDHVPYAIKFGVWQRGMEPFRVVLEDVWKPYLDGHGSRDEAFAELIKRIGIDPKPN